MTESEFALACEDMVDSLPGSSAKGVLALYRKFGQQPRDVIIKAVDIITMNEQRFPVPKRFLQAVYEAKRAIQGNTLTEKREVIPCDYCDGNGYIFATHLTSKRRVVFGCRCENAEYYPKYPSLFNRKDFDMWVLDNNEAVEYLSPEGSRNVLKYLERFGKGLPDKMRSNIKDMAEKSLKMAEDVPF